MNKYRKFTAWLGAGAILLTIGAGCADKNNNGVPDAGANVASAAVDTTGNVVGAAGDTTSNMASAASNNLSDAGQAVDNSTTAAGNNLAQGANSAANATGNAVASTGSALSNMGAAATYTPKIKTALGASPALKGSEINVDTLGSKDTIALRGTVTSAAQKTLAESIAKKNAPSFKIANQLVVGKAKM